jgi:hypothetical protein
VALSVVCRQVPLKAALSSFGKVSRLTPFNVIAV